MLDASNNIHTFHPVIGLTLLKTGHSAPTVAALACLADSMGVLCHIMEVVSKLFVKHCGYCGQLQAFDPGCGCKHNPPVAQSNLH